MNQEEMACCRRMVGDCGAMSNSGHSCCKKIAQASDILAFNSVGTHPSQDHQTTQVAALSVPDSTLPDGHPVRRIFSPSHSPPLANGSSLVLRI